MPSERCSDGIFYGFGFDFNLFCLKYRLKTRIATRLLFKKRIVSNIFYRNLNRAVFIVD
ncbi:hypothetical protein [Neisseria meningitidis]|uniref:hypothetical protein n=1 Tax=Neisseria meningitidis TaxID=487 RepID=UPI000A9BE0D8|nr:hypothetical protein [Neisseria meningitidis]